jgi:hypothetical protein
LTPADVIGRLGIPDVLFEDLQHLIEVGEQRVPARQRACAEQLARSGRFTEWLRSSTSSQLLVHANYSENANISGLSLFCFSLANVLAGRPDRFIPLVFFCGMHAELPDEDEEEEDEEEPRDSHSVLLSAAHAQKLQERWLNMDTIGARGLMLSFIHQLLGRYYHPRGISIAMTPQELHDTENRNLRALYELFRRLVRMLPESVTVCFPVDGTVYYERDEFLRGMERIMVPLLQLSQPGITRARLKVLLTSPTDTSDVREWFAQESILSMREIDRPGLVSESTELERILATAIE